MNDYTLAILTGLALAIYVPVAYDIWQTKYNEKKSKNNEL